MLTRIRSIHSTRLVALLGLAFVLMTIVTGVLLHVAVRDLTAAYTGTGINPFQGIGDGESEEPPPAPGITVTPTMVTFQVTPQPWDGKARVTVLLMGLDYRDWVRGKGAPRTDTMMLISVDPLTRRVSMLSIPRDLWVEIPGFGHNRINTAYMFGEAYRLPGGGPALAVQTVEDLIGVPIQYYAVIDFSTFERLIDEIGGIEVLVKQRIKISPIGRQSRWLEAKPYHLDGAEALAYARVRKGAGDDFGRAERQQQVALAILDRVVGFDMLPSLIAKAPALYQELAAGVRTNMTLDDMVSLAWLGLNIPKENILRGVIGPPNMVGFNTRPDGAKVLRPVPDQIRALRDELFVDTSAIGPVPPGEGGEP